MALYQRGSTDHKQGKNVSSLNSSGYVLAQELEDVSHPKLLGTILGGGDSFIPVGPSSGSLSPSQTHGSAPGTEKSPVLPALSGAANL